MSEIYQWSARQISEAIRNRKITAREATEAALLRLANVNPLINAVIAEMPQQALEAADLIDEKLSRGEDPGPLAGVPVTVKVNIDQAGFATTNGLRIQQDLIAQTDSPVVSSLRRSGAIIIGRTNTPAFSTLRYEEFNTWTYAQPF